MSIKLLDGSPIMKLGLFEDSYFLLVPPPYLLIDETLDDSCFNELGIPRRFGLIWLVTSCWLEQRLLICGFPTLSISSFTLAIEPSTGTV